MIKLIKISGAFLILMFAFLSNLNAQGYVCAIGGGSENYNDWSDEPYRWIVQKADSGKIIIIDVADASNWLPNYFMSLGADTAYNKTISSTSVANLQSIYDELITAKGIFIRGGDQWNYIRTWKGTKVDSAIQYVFNNGGVIAGTSAGAAVLGEIDFSAQSGSAYPDEALLNPFYSRMKFENNFLKLVNNVLFDTHFIERGRHGRLIAMLYNLFFTQGRNVVGVGIDDRTAICISPDGIGEVMGSGAVTILYKDDLTKYSTYVYGKYTIENLKAHILTKGWKFNFNLMQIEYIPNSAKDVDTSRSYQFPLTDLYLTGSNSISEHLNSNFSSFLASVNNGNILVITHPGYSSSLTPLVNFLNNNNLNYSILYLTSSNLNDQNEMNKILNATCFVFAGDSLNVLSYLNQNGKLIPDAFQYSIASGKPVFFFGNSGKISGGKYVDNTDSDNYASYRGKMTLNDGLKIFSDLIFQPLIFENSNYYENRMSAVLWGLMRNRARTGIYLNGSGGLKISSADKTIRGNVSIPYLIIDARKTTKVDSSTYRASRSIGPRQVVAMNDLRISLTNFSDIKYSIADGKFDNLTNVEIPKQKSSEKSFILYQNFPNPFNSSTKIKFEIKETSSQNVRLEIFDSIGRLKQILVNESLKPGNYEVEFNSSDLSSGIYFYKLSTQNFSETKAMILLK